MTPSVGLESIHLDQQLVSTSVPARHGRTETGSRCRPTRVDFVDKNDAKAPSFCLEGKVTDHGSADADEHFYENGTADAETGPRFPATHEPTDLTGSRAPRATPFGNSAAKFCEFFRIF